MYLVLTPTPTPRTPCNCIPASLWPRVCCMSAPFPCCVVFCWCVFSVLRFLLGAQHVFRLEKITNPIVCATFSTVLARFLPQRFCFASPLFPLSASYLFQHGTNLRNAFCCCSSVAVHRENRAVNSITIF